MKTIDLPCAEGLPPHDFLKAIIQTAPAGKGLTLADVRAGIRLLDIIDASDSNVLTLEDSDYNYLVRRLRDVAWSRVDRKAVAIIDAIEAAGNGSGVAAGHSGPDVA